MPPSFGPNDMGALGGGATTAATNLLALLADHSIAHVISHEHSLKRPLTPPSPSKLFKN